MNRNVAIGAVGALVAVGVTLSGGFSYSSQFNSGGAHVSTQLSPYALLAWPVALLVVAGSWRLHSPASNDRRPEWYRVLLALYVDFSVYLIVAIVPLCVLALGLEGRAVADFEWQFSRDFARPTDGVLTAMSILLFASAWGALGLPMWASRESPGGLLVGVAVRRVGAVPFWRCAAFGVFKYFSLGIPPLALLFGKAGRFEAQAVASRSPHAG